MKQNSKLFYFYAVERSAKCRLGWQKLRVGKSTSKGRGEGKGNTKRTHEIKSLPQFARLLDDSGLSDTIITGFFFFLARSQSVSTHAEGSKGLHAFSTCEKRKRTRSYSGRFYYAKKVSVIFLL